MNRRDLFKALAAASVVPFVPLTRGLLYNSAEVPPGTGTITPEMAQKIRAYWEASFSGPDSGRVAVLDWPTDGELAKVIADGLPKGLV